MTQAEATAIADAEDDLRTAQLALRSARLHLKDLPQTEKARRIIERAAHRCGDAMTLLLVAHSEASRDPR